MVILGGLEIVVGGYIIHKYHKNKNEKKKLQEEAISRRHNTFPGAKPQPYPQHHQQYPPVPQQKHAYYDEHSKPQYQPRPHTAHMPQRRPLPPHAQSEPHYQPPIEPLRRQQSFAGSLSNMPIANGSRPHDVPAPPPLQHSQSMGPGPGYPYYNTGFSASYPSFEPVSDAPTHVVNHRPARHTVDDNWEAYGPPSPHVHFAVSDSPQPGERDDDPPPPYRP